MSKKLKAYAVISLLVSLIIVDLFYIFKQAPPANTPKPATKLFSIVRLVGQDGKTFCSGTVINDNTIITASHCVASQAMFGVAMSTEPIEIRADDNISRGVFGVAYFSSGQMDQALITGNFKRFQARPYISKPDALTAIRIKEGTQFVSCGYPLHGDLYCTSAVLVKPLAFFWAVRGVLLPGMSGGPTMLMDGTVVAVNVAVENDLSIVSPIYNLYPNNKPKGK